jgi:hypothetical protein
MSQITLHNVQPLIAQLDVQNRSVRVEFQCPVSQQTVSSSHHVSQQRGLANNLKRDAQRSVMYSVQRAFSQLLRDVFGSNVFTRTIDNAGRRTLSQAGQQQMNKLSQSEIDEAVVAAFEKVASRFAWDASRATWVLSSALQQSLSPFQAQLHNHPVRNGYDQQLLARMLVTVAMADGSLALEEMRFFENTIPANVGTVSSLSAMPPLTAAELSSVTDVGVKRTMLMLAWMLAYCDEEFHPQEGVVIQQLASNLGLSAQDAQQAAHLAQTQVLEQVMSNLYRTQGFSTQTRQQMLATAQRMGVSESEALSMEAQFQRRNA